MSRFLDQIRKARESRQDRETGQRRPGEPPLDQSEERLLVPEPKPGETVEKPEPPVAATGGGEPLFPEGGASGRAASSKADPKKPRPVGPVEMPEELEHGRVSDDDTGDSSVGEVTESAPRVLPEELETRVPSVPKPAVDAEAKPPRSSGIPEELETRMPSEAKSEPESEPVSEAPTMALMPDDLADFSRHDSAGGKGEALYPRELDDESRLRRGEADDVRSDGSQPVAEEIGTLDGVSFSDLFGDAEIEAEADHPADLPEAPITVPEMPPKARVAPSKRRPVEPPEVSPDPVGVLPSHLADVDESEEDEEPEGPPPFQSTLPELELSGPRVRAADAQVGKQGSAPRRRRHRLTRDRTGGIARVTLSGPEADPEFVRRIAKVAPRPHKQMVTFYDPKHHVCEEYRLLGKNLLHTFANLPGNGGGSLLDPNLGRVVALTSSVRGEGKTLTCINLAMTLAQDYADRVILLDGDLRHPKVHRYMGLPNNTGLNELLSAPDPMAVLEDCVVRTDSGLHLLTATATSGNPAPLLDSPAMTQLLQILRGRYGLIIIDTPPVLLATDALTFGVKSDGMLFLLRARKTQREQIQEARQRIARLDIRLLGYVMNNVKSFLPRIWSRYYYGNY